MISALITVLIVFVIAAVVAFLIDLCIPGGKWQKACYVILGLIVFLIVVHLLWPFVASVLHLGAEPRSLR